MDFSLTFKHFPVQEPLAMRLAQGLLFSSKTRAIPVMKPVGIARLNDHNPKEAIGSHLAQGKDE